MSLTIADRVKETTTTTGTGTIDLAGAATGFQSFVAGAGDAAEVEYSIVGQAGGGAEGEWEVGRGTVTDASPDTLSRTTILASSNGGSAVNFSAGTKDVFLTASADLLRYPIVGVARDFGSTQTLANTGGAWTAVDTNLDVTIPARVGDLIVASVSLRTTGSIGHYYDLVTIDSGGAFENYFSSNGTTPLSIGGQPGLGGNNAGEMDRSARTSHVLVANDVVSGEVTVRLIYRVDGATVSCRPNVVIVTNYGPS